MASHRTLYPRSKDDSTTKRGLFDLPAEIRIMIMFYALVSEKVRPCEIDTTSSYLPKTKPWGLSNRLKALQTFNNIHSMRASGSLAIYSHDSGVGLLATCRQAYNEGHRMFYELNTFQLPHGPLKHSLQYFQGLTHEHRAMISKVAIHLGWSDFTPEVLLKIEQEAMLPDTPVGFGTPLASLAMEHVEKIWKEKIEWLSSCRDLGEIRQIEVRRFSMPKQTLHELQELNILLLPSATPVGYALRNFIPNYGWELTKLWILSGARKVLSDNPGTYSYPARLFDPVIWNNGKQKYLGQIRQQRQKELDLLKLSNIGASQIASDNAE
ncbi:MAG: hypothetical protein LQ342_005655 [Letrouitia transgressa]|nr:MAG: hypothetical protein LQ342_005655 [Letrouitia transgressa]